MGVNQWNTSGCCGQNAGCNSGSTGSTAPCCTTCGLTIDPNGNSLPTQPQRPQPRARRHGCRNMPCHGSNFVPLENGCNACGRQQDSCNSCSNNNGTSCGCQQDNCNSCSNNNGNSCGCQQNNCIQPRQGFNWTQQPSQPHTAMVYHEEQPLTGLPTVEDALFHGSLFPELVKPMNCIGPCSRKGCASQGQLQGFAAWDLRLYLDTHPQDSQALNLWQQMNACSGCGSYATAFVGNCANGWTWTNDPWPWEYQANCCN